MPILVGAASNNLRPKGYQLDNQGINISDKNKNYSELTGIYWAWKNLTSNDLDAIGLIHYRRIFSNSFKRNLHSILSNKEISNLLTKAPVIVPKKRRYYIESNYSHYIHAHNNEPLLLLIKLIKQKYPQYYPALKETLHKRSAHMFNMFIMKKDYFDSYCKMMFGILFDLQKQLDISSYSPQEQRVFGYLSELLLDVWIRKNNIKYVECNWVQLGKRNLMSKLWNFLKRKVVKKSSQEDRVTHF